MTAALDRVRDAIRKHIPAGYEESNDGKYQVWQVPLSAYPDTYNGKPLMYVGLAEQKNYNALYLMPAYGSERLVQRLRDGFRAAGKKLDMGKSCVRFREADDLALDAIADIVAAVPMVEWIRIAREAHAPHATRRSAGKRAGRAGAAKRVEAKKRRG